MASFDNELLFNSGPTEFRIGKAELRYTIQYPPGSTGILINSQGQEARQIGQTGTLVADTIEQLKQQIDAIEAKVDGLLYELVDTVGRVWTSTAMLSFDHEQFIRTGVRWKTDYHVEYLQALP